jgi:hypothetical protein
MNKLVSFSLLFLMVCVPAVAFSADVAQDFSFTTNPNTSTGWQYGWSTSINSALNLYPNYSFTTPLASWQDYGHISLGAPAVSLNTASSAYASGTVHWNANQFLMHPGSSGEYCHAIWTATGTGHYAINALFSGQDDHGTTTDVHILKNGASIFDSSINGYGVTTPYLDTIDVALGDTIDFAVGYGNGNFYYDSTGLSAQINAVPEPLSCALFILGGATIAIRRRVRR